MGESPIMAARIALLLALVAAVSARDWHYQFRHPTVTPNPRANNPFRPSKSAPVQPQAVRGTKAVPNCGQSKSTKIVGGNEVTPHEYPWQVDFFTHENWNSFTLSNDLALIRMPAPIVFTDTIQ